MIFYIRTRNGWDEFKEIGLPDCPVWVDRDVLSRSELDKLRAAGADITNFTTETGSDPDLQTLQMHHPDEVIWVEAR